MTFWFMKTPENKELSFNPMLSDDYRYLILTVWKGTENKSRIYYRDEQAEGEICSFTSR